VFRKVSKERMTCEKGSDIVRRDHGSRPLVSSSSRLDYLGAENEAGTLPISSG
jgi:hypothetical protein